MEVDSWYGSERRARELGYVLLMTIHPWKRVLYLATIRGLGHAQNSVGGQTLIRKGILLRDGRRRSAPDLGRNRREVRMEKESKKAIVIRH